jgi:hypothetical protein
MINKRFDLIEKSDIDLLVASAEAENRTLEYKETLPCNSDGDKKEFLADISSFANAAGGDIIYGISEKRDANGKPTGIPEAANGLAGINADAEIRRLENTLRDGLTPRIIGLQLKTIDGFTSGPILIIRVPNSWNAPHMIAKGDSRFFSRNSAGKYPLDVNEIRSAFALGASIPEKVRRFRDDRIDKVIAGETPVVLAGDAKTILHILPVAALDPTYRVDLQKVARFVRLVPIGARGRNQRFNFDGFVTYDGPINRPSGSYVQVFRNGAIEAAEIYLLIDRPSQGTGIISPVKFEQTISEALAVYLNAEVEWGITPPYFVMVSLVGVKGYIMSTKDVIWLDGLQPIERDVLLLPDILIEDESNTNIPSLLRPVFDALWQSSGLSGSMNYDNEGNWKVQAR